MSRKPHNKIGQKFGRLTVVSQGPTLGHHVRWNCVCECGGASIVASEKLGRTTNSCGCLKAALIGDRSRKHGQSGDHKATPEYKSWKGAKSRCYNPKSERYPLYGGRGIVMSEEWRHDYHRFFADMGPRPPGTSLDRINNDGPYAPDNCRWATASQQQSNTRQNVFVLYKGERITLTELARRMRVSVRALHKAFHKKQGDPVEIALRIRARSHSHGDPDSGDPGLPT